MTGGDRYLWDGSGPPDPEVEALERVLAPLRASGEPPAAGRGSAPGPMEDSEQDRAPADPARPRRHLGWWAAAAAAVALAAAWIGQALLGAGAPQVRLILADTGRLLAVGEERRVEGRDELLTMETPRFDEAGEPTGEFDWTGELTLAPGSQLRVDSLSHEQTDLHLERGAMEAFVSAEARPGFFQVGTPAARCIDLGCRYTLRVDENGDAQVEVLMGQVAFVNRGGREVLVLFGATCRASRSRGAGTPRFAESRPEFLAALDAFDAADAAARPQAAQRVVQAAVAAAPGQVKLPLWHLLGDPDREVARAALRHLEPRFGHPSGLAAGQLPDAQGLERWKQHLGLGW